MVFMRLLGLIMVAVSVFAADAKVLAIPSADRVVVEISRFPVSLSLAHIEVPASIAPQTQKELTSLLSGKEVRIDYSQAWGVDASGTAKVHLKVGSVDVVVRLVEEGLAKVVPGAQKDAIRERLLETAQDRARTSKKGLWGASMPAIAATAPPANPPAMKGAFAAELNSQFYYPSDHRSIANINKQRLIYYPDEAAAKKAGKVPAPIKSASALPEATEASADKIFGEGEKIYAAAIAAGNSTKRDDLYGEAYVKLSEAMNIYSGLVEADEKNEALAEKLRRCMQLRYGAVKQRRVH